MKKLYHSCLGALRAVEVRDFYSFVKNSGAFEYVCVCVCVCAAIVKDTDFFVPFLIVHSCYIEMGLIFYCCILS